MEEVQQGYILAGSPAFLPDQVAVMEGWAADVALVGGCLTALPGVSGHPASHAPRTGPAHMEEAVREEQRL